MVEGISDFDFLMTDTLPQLLLAKKILVRLSNKMENLKGKIFKGETTAGLAQRKCKNPFLTFPLKDGSQLFSGLTLGGCGPRRH